ncbi:MAG TPA: Gfo/Idh/MocA family oxidoreductase [Actinomycetota bacterium]|nr:Gfo/Idh/MocA family oxidoreductase [Actinomycetota bacterium]
MDDKVRWGILGTGKIARILSTALAESQDGELVAVGSRDAERAASLAAEFGAPRSYGTYMGVIDDEDVDLVYVATHHPGHRKWAVAAADGRRHVLCEKPIAVTHEHAVEIVEAARRNDVFLLEAFAYRCHPQTQRLVELLREGVVGEVRMIDAVFGYDGGPEPGNYLMIHELAGGSILDVGCYTTSMSHLIAAAATDRAVAPTMGVAGAGFIGPTGVDHSTAATLTFDGGIVARVACSIRANLDSAVRIYGSAGRITVPSPWLPGRIGAEARIVVERWGADAQVIDVPVEQDVYTVEVDAVNAFVRKGERSPSAMSWDESLENARTLDRWRAAIGLRYPDDGP